MGQVKETSVLKAHNLAKKNLPIRVKSVESCIKDKTARWSAGRYFKRARKMHWI